MDSQTLCLRIKWPVPSSNCQTETTQFVPRSQYSFSAPVMRSKCNSTMWLSAALLSQLFTKFLLVLIPGINSAVSSTFSAISSQLNKGFRDTLQRMDSLSTSSGSGACSAYFSSLSIYFLLLPVAEAELSPSITINCRGWPGLGIHWSILRAAVWTIQSLEFIDLSS